MREGGECRKLRRDAVDLSVLCSLIELVQGGTSGLSVLRTFRLLRILKLVRFMPALRYQLVVMLRTMDNVAMFFILLLLFIFIFRSQQHLVLGSSLTATICLYINLFIQLTL